MKALVIGGGIGGLCAALALRRQGVEAHVYERAPALAEVGAGIHISSNGSRVLRRLGLGEELETVGMRTTSLEMRDMHTNDLLIDGPLGEPAAERYGAPYYACHRADLLDILARALPAEAIHVGMKCVNVEDAGGSSGRVIASFDDGARVSGDLLVGADGMRSLVAAQLLGPETRPGPADLLAVRMLIPADKAADVRLEHRSVGWWGPGRGAMTYRVRDGELLNFLAFLPDTDRRDARGVVPELRARFAGCTPELAQIVGLVDAPFVTAIHDRAPLSRWSRGRVTLLGDAAHPMHPFLGQGANMAIEDAATLAVAVARRGEGAVEEALRDYEQLRLPRVTKVGSEARTRGEALLMRDPDGIAARNRRLQAMRASDPLAEAAWGWVWRHDAVSAAEAFGGAVPAPA